MSGPSHAARFRNLGCAAMFTYLTGFRAAEVRPLHISGKTKECVIVTSATRKKGQAEVLKLREWSTKLRVVIARQTDAPDAAPIPVHQLRRPGVHTVGYGVGMAGRNVRWIASFATKAAAALARKRAAELEYILSNSSIFAVKA